MQSPAITAARAAVPHEDLKDALRSGQLRLHYHPIVSLETGRPRGVEALLRWEHPRGGTLVPEDFLPGVAHTPVMQDITRWVLSTALTDVKAWPGWTVSVNLSTRDVTQPDVLHHVDEALSASGIAPERLILELTEQAMIQSLEEARKVLAGLRDMGVGLSLDDFGTGYSSLLYLRELPITELKIDRAFLARVPGTAEDLAIVRSVAKLGRFLGIGVIAEGLETLEQAQIARTARCTGGQGYLWGRPMPAEQIDPAQLVVMPELVASPRKAKAVKNTEAVGRIQELSHEGASLHTIAAALNADGLQTPNRTRWTAATVALVVTDLPSV